MSLVETIAALAKAAPPDATVTVRWLAEQLARESSVGRPAPAVSVDLTVAALATLFERSPGAVRDWIRSGAFPNAYRLNGREWRVPHADVVAMQREQSTTHPQRTASRRPADTSAWRQHLPAKAA